MPAAYQASGDGAPVTAGTDPTSPPAPDALPHGAGRIARRPRLQRALDHREDLRAGPPPAKTSCSPAARLHPAGRAASAGQRVRRQVAQARGRAAHPDGAVRPARSAAPPAAPEARRRRRPASRRTYISGRHQRRDDGDQQDARRPARTPQPGDQPADPVDVHPVADVERDDQPADASNPYNATSRPSRSSARHAAAGAAPARPPRTARGPAGWAPRTSPSAGSSRRARGTG